MDAKDITDDICIKEILKETSQVIISGNGDAEDLLKKYKEYLKHYDKYQDEIKNAIIILEEIIMLRSKLDATKSKKNLWSFKNKINILGLTLISLFLIIGVSAGINYKINGANKLNVEENETLITNFVNITDDLYVKGNASVFDITIRNPGSLKILVGNETVTLSAVQVIIGGQSRNIANFNSDFQATRTYNGSLYFAARNLDFSENSNTIVDALSADGEGLALIKYNSNRTRNRLGLILNNRGDLDIFNTNEPYNTTIRFGFSDGVQDRVEFSLTDIINRTDVMIMSINETNITNKLNANAGLDISGSIFNFGNNFIFNDTDGIIGIGNFTNSFPFKETNSLDKGIHIRNGNGALVLEEINDSADTVSKISLQAGSSNKFFLKDEVQNLEYFKIDNEDNFIFELNKSITIGDGTGTKEITILTANNEGNSSVYSMYEGSYQNNGFEWVYDSGANHLSLYDWTGGSRLGTPNIRFNRNSPMLTEVGWELSIGDTNTGSNAGTDLCIDANNKICACGSCA